MQTAGPIVSHRCFAYGQSAPRPCLQRRPQLWKSTQSRHRQENARCWRHRATPSPEEYEKMLAEASKNPEMNSQMQKMERMMQDPNVQAQMQQYMTAMQSPQMQEIAKSLQADPEISQLLDKAKAGGPGGIMSLLQDKSLMDKVYSKMGGLGDIQAAPSPAAPSPAAAAPPRPQHEIKDLIDAARYGDLEAAEDLIYVGKDINQRDEEQRTPLHYAIAYDNPEVWAELIQAEADLSAVDSKGNSPLHYAAGYGRPTAVTALLKAGADGSLANSDGHTPHQLVLQQPANAINSSPQLLADLEQAASRL